MQFNIDIVKINFIITYLLGVAQELKVGFN